MKGVSVFFLNFFLRNSLKSVNSDNDNESDLQDNQQGCLQDDPKRPLRHLQKVVTLRPCNASRNLLTLYCTEAIQRNQV